MAQEKQICGNCIHVHEWHSSKITYRCGKIRGKYDEKEDEYEEQMKVSKNKDACQFYEYRGY